MVKYCAVAVCTNSSKKRPNLSYFCFPCTEKIHRKWEVFCRRADDKFKTLSDPRICSPHFRGHDIKKGLSGKTYVISEAVPRIFDPKKEVTEDKIRKDRREKWSLRIERSAHDDETAELPAKRNKSEVEDSIDPVSHSQLELTVVNTNLTPD